MAVKFTYIYSEGESSSGARKHTQRAVEQYLEMPVLPLKAFGSMDGCWFGQGMIGTCETLRQEDSEKQQMGECGAFNPR